MLGSVKLVYVRLDTKKITLQIHESSCEKKDPCRNRTFNYLFIKKIFWLFSFADFSLTCRFYKASIVFFS